ncbi:MAG: hypothetical protein ACI4L8_01935 [Candidatus Fimadaptatus sp.]
MDMAIRELQPSQFYLSAGKLERVRSWFDPRDMSGFEPLPVKLLDGRHVLTDGHTRAFAALSAGLERVPVVWDEDELDWEAYRIDVAACLRRGVAGVEDLAGRVLSEADYARKWRGWCDVVHEVLSIQRSL